MKHIAMQKKNKNFFANSSTIKRGKREQHQSFYITYKQFIKELNIYKTPETGFDTTQEVKIVFYHTMNKDLQDVLDAYIADFNLIYPTETKKGQGTTFKRLRAIEDTI